MKCESCDAVAEIEKGQHVILLQNVFASKRNLLQTLASLEDEPQLLDWELAPLEVQEKDGWVFGDASCISTCPKHSVDGKKTMLLHKAPYRDYLGIAMQWCAMQIGLC